jgi:hypothetical protein
MSATYEQIKEEVLGLISSALEEEKDILMMAVNKENEKGQKLSIGVTILPSEDSKVNEILVSLSFVPEKIQIKMDGFTSAA